MRLPAVGQNRCASIVERLEVRRMLHAGDVDLLPADLQPYARDDGHVLQSDFLRVRPEFIGMNLWAADTFNPTHSTNPADWLYDPHTIESQMPVDYPAIATSSATTQAVINLPDLVPLTSGPYLQPFIDTTEIPGHTLLRFTTSVGNQGSGPAILTSSNTGTPPAGSGITSWINADGTQNVLQRLYTTSGTSFVFNSYRPAGRMVYHPTHGHFHLDGYARYRLLTKVINAPGPVALRSNWDNSQAVGDKIGFCLVDFNNTFTLPAGGSSATLPTYSYTGAPVVGCGFLQGLNVGRADVYDAIYDGQWIDVTGVPNGDYFLEVTIDAQNVIQESNDANNTVLVPVTIANSAAPGGIAPDRFEPNNTFSQATDLGELGVQTQPGLTIHVSDESDYFRFTAASTGTYTVQLSVADRDVNLFVYDASQTLLGSSTSPAVGPMTETVTLAFAKGSTYYVQARGFGSDQGTSGVSSNYALKINVAPTIGVAPALPIAHESGAIVGQFSLARNGPVSGPLVVDFSITGTATRGVDYAIYHDGVLITGNSVTIGVEASSATLDVVPIADALVEPTETVVLTLSPNAAAYVVDAPSGSATVSIADAPPTVVASSFTFDALPLGVRFEFTLDVSASLAPSDVDVQNVRTGTHYAASAVSWDSTKRRATFALPAALPDGDYRATLAAAGVTHAAGAPLAADATLDFFAFAGDANHDRKVDLADFTALASNFNRAGATFAQGNFNYDGFVDLLDFTILATNFNKTLSAPTAAAAAARTTSLPPPPPAPAPAATSPMADTQPADPLRADLLPDILGI